MNLIAAEAAVRTTKSGMREQAMRESALKLDGIIRRHQKELNLPGVVGIYQVGADAIPRMDPRDGQGIDTPT